MTMEWNGDMGGMEWRHGWNGLGTWVENVLLTVDGLW